MNAVETDADIKYKVAFDDGWDHSIEKMEMMWKLQFRQEQHQLQYSVMR